MDTSALKSFAPWARTALINEVTGRVAAVLGPASPERVEQPRAVAALENAIKDVGGGGDASRAAVAEQVAYTWFNRIIALRFMDANGYTGIGVVSPQADIDVGQPEILADAKAGNLEPEVVSPQIRDTVSALLNGTRRSSDPQGEAYALLLTEYCRFWNRAMPFMFEREGDFTELLMPANLLADDSVLNRAVKVMTKDVCNDVEVIGWLYQFYIAERKDEVFAGFKKGKKAGAAEIPAATQLFTPHWIVRYLVENSLGRLWMLNRPDSRLIDQMDYYISPVDEETDFLKINSPEELTVMDPACGSGHMLTYAFDLLYAIYEEEGHDPADIPSSILTKNLFGTEIDRRAGQLAAFALTMKSRAKQRTFFKKQVEPNICVLEPIWFGSDELDGLLTEGGDQVTETEFWNQFKHSATFGALIRPDAALTARLDEYLADTIARDDDLLRQQIVSNTQRVLIQARVLSNHYAVVVTNPPYMGRGNMGTSLNEFVELSYPASAWGLDATFIDRSWSMVSQGGLCALVTMQSWMYLPSYERFRSNLLATRSINNLAHLGAGVFESLQGEVVSVVAAVYSHADPSTRGAFLRLLDLDDDTARQAAFTAARNNPNHPRRFNRVSSGFSSLRGSLIAYFANSEIAAFLDRPPIRDFVVAGVGSQTGENDRFVRYWFEVSSDKINRDGKDAVDRKRWTPATKGGEFRRWYNPTIAVMDWRQNGSYIKRECPGAVIRNADIYFRENLSWTKIGSRIPSFRYSDDRVVHNDASCFVVPTKAPIDSVSAYLNSRTVASLVKELNPTLNLRPVSLLDFPFVEIDEEQGKECRNISKQDWDRQELSLNFVGNPLANRSGSRKLRELADNFVESDALRTNRLAELENQIEKEVAAEAGLPDPDIIPKQEHSLTANPAYRYGPSTSYETLNSLVLLDLSRDLLSYAVGCMFGRYSLDEPGLILADQGATLQDYLAKVSDPTFMPDADNVIPIVDGDWFEDDIVARFRQFLRAAFGEEHFEENLRFVTESLGVKDLRDYFAKRGSKATTNRFYDDHVQRYKKRPIYWLFSSPKGSFNALIYMHRYTPSTVSTVLNEYLREYKAKLKASLENQERVATGGGTAREQAKAQKEADRLRKVLLELDEYEHDVLYPLASQQIEIDLDDGVKANYPKFGAALKKIPGLEAAE